MSHVTVKKHNDLTEGPILSKILLFSLPLIATSILQLLFNTADTVVVGRWGGATPEECETALAAVGSCGSLISLFVNFFMGFSIGAGICVAHDIGAKLYHDVKKTVHTSVVVALVSGTLIMVVGLCFAEPLLILMKTEKTVLDQAVPYICAYFCGMPANMLYNYCAAILRSDGDTTRPLFFLTVAGVVNVLLNLVMVLVFHAGALGVGVATATSHWVSCILIVIYMLRMEGPCKIELKKIGVDKRKMTSMLSIGLPAGIQSTFFSISNVLIQSSLNSLGKVVVAGNTAASNLESYIYATQHSLQQAAMTFVGQHVGAKKYTRMKKCVARIVAVVLFFGITVGWAIFLLAKPLLNIYIPDNAPAVQAGINRLAIMGTTYFLLGLMEIGSGVLRGMGKSVQPMVITLIGTCAFRVIWIYTVFVFLHTSTALYLSYPISWFLTGAVQWLLVFYIFRKQPEQLT
ncbi:MAG: MATE family efflux transporter [Clostridia bacterium]|nr:MATE family efflux transporter [Clostridia bacterium]